MKIQYFADSDTLHIMLKDRPVAETRDLDDNTTLDHDSEGRIVALTLEHASLRADLQSVSYQQLPAPTPRTTE